MGHYFSIDFVLYRMVRSKGKLYQDLKKLQATNKIITIYTPFKSTSRISNVFLNNMFKVVNKLYYHQHNSSKKKTAQEKKCINTNPEKYAIVIIVTVYAICTIYVILTLDVYQIPRC